MKLVGKCLTFMKENKSIVFALAVVLLSFVFLAIPGAFAHYDYIGIINGHKTFRYNFSGYQWIFGTVKNILDVKIGSPSAQGIAIFVMLILCVPGLLFSKKSSFVALLTTLALITISVLFFTISAAGPKAYPLYHIPEKNHAYSLMLWVPYLLGSFTVLAGGLMGYRTFKVMKDEVEHPTASSKGPSYNYLHK